MNIKQLQELQLGDVAAESDPALVEYFVNTIEYNKVVTDQADLILGIKGSGKSAIYVILQKKRKTIPELKNTIFIPSTQDEAETIELIAEKYMNDVAPKDFEILWYYIISRAIYLKLGEPPFIDLEPVTELRLKFPFERYWNEPVLRTEHKVTYMKYIREANDVLGGCEHRVWFLMDKLDKFFEKAQDRTKRIELLSSLIRVYINVREYQNTRLKIFLRTDLFKQLSNITDKDKLSRQISLKWDQDKLLELLVSRLIKLNPSVVTENGTTESQFLDVFEDVMGESEKKGYTKNWLYNHLKDGNDVITPRDLLWLVGFAKDEQNASSLKQKITDGIKISGRAIKKSFYDKFSEHKFNSYLTNEFPLLNPVFSRFKNGGSKYSKPEMITYLGSEEVLSDLLETGFMRFIPSTMKRSLNNEDTYEISEMYWGALGIKRRYQPTS